MNIESVYLCGNFTRWQVNLIAMEKLSDTRFETEIALQAGEQYEFRYRTVDHDNVEYWQSESDSPHKRSNSGWNENCVRTEAYDKARRVVGWRRFTTSLYS